MKQPELGKRLKEARISKKLTQSEVVGSFITRNMLSQIESGKAMPSLETLQYLAEVLGIPPQSLISTPALFSEPQASDTGDDLTLLIQAKESLRSGEFRNVLKLRHSYAPSLEDEFNALLAIACCELAEQLIQGIGASGSLSTKDHDPAAEAVALAKEAMERSTQGIYANELVHSRAMLFFHDAVNHL